MTQSLSGGGAERLAANLSIGLKDNSDITIVTYWSDDEEYDYFGKRINLDLVGNSVVKKAICSIKRIIEVKKIKKANNIQLSISFVPSCDYVNILTKRKNEKTIIDVVSNMSKVYPNGFRRVFRKFVLNKADFLVTDSEGVRQDLLNSFNLNCEKKSKTIYSSLDILEIRRKCEENANIDICKKAKKYISCMGSFRMAKGHWHLIKAFSTIKDDIPDLNLVILGDGVYREKYEELIYKLGLQERVFLPGYINFPHEIINRSIAFVFSSVYEGMGNSIIEAMASGTPVVSVDCKFGAREILDPSASLSHICTDVEICEYGIITPGFPMEDIDITTSISKEEKLLGKGIERLLSDEGFRNEYIKKGFEYCKKFDNTEITNQWKNVMEIVSKND